MGSPSLAKILLRSERRPGIDAEPSISRWSPARSGLQWQLSRSPFEPHVIVMPMPTLPARRSAINHAGSTRPASAMSGRAISALNERTVVVREWLKRRRTPRLPSLGVVVLVLCFGSSAATQTLSPTGGMSTDRNYLTLTRLPDGRVLSTGGGGSAGADLSTAEILTRALESGR